MHIITVPPAFPSAHTECITQTSSTAESYSVTPVVCIRDRLGSSFATGTKEDEPCK